MHGISTAQLPEIAGLLGVVLYVGAYAALQTGLLRSNGYSYAAANLAAAAMVLLSLSQDFNLSAAMSQIIWIFLSVFGMIRMVVLERRARLALQVGNTGLARSLIARMLSPDRWASSACSKGDARRPCGPALDDRS